jgi:hypothetical protein
MFTEMGLFESTALTPLRFCLWRLMKSEVNRRKVDTADELLLGFSGYCWQHNEA